MDIFGNGTVLHNLPWLGGEKNYIGGEKSQEYTPHALLPKQININAQTAVIFSQPLGHHNAILLLT